MVLHRLVKKKLVSVAGHVALSTERARNVSATLVTTIPSYSHQSTPVSTSPLKETEYLSVLTNTVNHNEHVALWSLSVEHRQQACFIAEALVRILTANTSICRVHLTQYGIHSHTAKTEINYSLISPHIWNGFLSHTKSLTFLRLSGIRNMSCESCASLSHADGTFNTLRSLVLDNCELTNRFEEALLQLVQAPPFRLP
jgi:hypothetical protein